MPPILGQTSEALATPADVIPIPTATSSGIYFNLSRFTVFPPVLHLFALKRGDFVFPLLGYSSTSLTAFAVGI
jgi:hypothetical protein